MGVATLSPAPYPAPSETFSMSGSFQVLANNGFSGPSKRKSTSNCPPARIGIQFDSWPAGAVGAKEMATDPSGFFCSPGVSDAALAAQVSNQRVGVRTYIVADR